MFSGVLYELVSCKLRFGFLYIFRAAAVSRITVSPPPVTDWLDILPFTGITATILSHLSHLYCIESVYSLRNGTFVL